VLFKVIATPASPSILPSGRTRTMAAASNHNQRNPTRIKKEKAPISVD
jgi:hypothetical protein